MKFAELKVKVNIPNDWTDKDIEQFCEIFDNANFPQKIYSSMQEYLRDRVSSDTFNQIDIKVE